MPNRRSPRGVARNFITHTAKYDRLKKESINTASEEDVLAELHRVFPKDPPAADAFPDGFVGVKGLVLTDTRGSGAFQVAGSVPSNKIKKP